MEKQVRIILGHPLSCSSGVHEQRVREVTRVMNQIYSRFEVSVWDLQLKHVLWFFTTTISVDCTQEKFLRIWVAVCALAFRKKVIEHWSKSMLKAVKPICARLEIVDLEVSTFKKEKIDPSLRVAPGNLVRFRDIELWQKRILPALGK